MGRGIACLQNALDLSESVVAVTGAGISVSAGISGFDGLAQMAHIAAPTSTILTPTLESCR